MQSKSNALIQRAVRPLLESLEGRRLMAMTVNVVDLDNNGTLDVQIQGDNAPDSVTIVDKDKAGSTIQLNDPAATFFIDANNNGVFTDGGDTNGAVVDTTTTPLLVGGGSSKRPIETYKINLEGGDDTLNISLGGVWNDSEKSILANLTYSGLGSGVTDKDLFVFNTAGYELRNKTDLTIDLQTGIDHDEADIDFARLDRALVNINLDMGTPGSELFPCETQEMQTMAFDALDTNGEYGGGDEVRIDFNNDIRNYSTVSVNVEYGSSYLAQASFQTSALTADYVSVTSLTLIVFHKTIDNSDVETNVQGGSVDNNLIVTQPGLNQTWSGDAVNIMGVLFRSDIKNDTEVFVNYNGGDDSIDAVGVGLDKGYDQRANADMYIDLQGGDNTDFLAVATTNILTPVSLSSGETNTVEFNTNTKFYYTLNLDDGGYRPVLAGDLEIGPTYPEQAFVMLGYNFFNDGHPGPASSDDSDLVSALASLFINDRDVRVHSGSKQRARLTGGDGDDDLYLGYGITKDAPTATGNFDITVEGGFGFDYVAYAFDKAGGSALTANNFKASGKALLDGGGEGISNLGNQIGLGDILDLIVDDGKSRNRNFEVNGSYPNQ